MFTENQIFNKSYRRELGEARLITSLVRCCSAAPIGIIIIYYAEQQRENRIRGQGPLIEARHFRLL